MRKLIITACFAFAAGFCTAAGTKNHEARSFLAESGVAPTLKEVGAKTDKQAPDIQFQKVQQVLNKADEARDTNRYLAAIKLYREAADSYVKLFSSFPDWQPGVTQFRIVYCNNQIEALMKKVDKTDLSLIEATGKSGPVRPLEIPAVTNKSPEMAKAPPVETVPGKARIENICSESKIFIEKGEMEKARPLLFAGLALEPDNILLRTLMGIVHCRKNEFDNAIYLMEPLVKEVPSNTIARVVLGTAYFGLGRTPDAKKQMQEALAINPRLKEAHYNLAQIMLTEKTVDTAAAREHYRKALEMGSKPDTNLDLLLREPSSPR